MSANPSFNTTLAEIRRDSDANGNVPAIHLDRLQSAHAAEIAERDAEVGQARRTADYWKNELAEANKALDTLRRQSEEAVRALHAEATEHKARADRAMGLLRECNAVALCRGDKYGLCDAIDNSGSAYQSEQLASLLSQQARVGGENGK